MKVGVTLQRTASTTLDVGSVITASSNPRRFKLIDFTVGSEAPPADNPFLWQIFARTGAATGGTAPTISHLDQSDTIASTLVANQAPSANGAGGSTAPLVSVPLNQRATYRWVAAPYEEMVSSNANSNGFAAATPTSSAVAVTTSWVMDEL